MLHRQLVVLLFLSTADNTVNLRVAFGNARTAVIAGNSRFQRWNENALKEYCTSFLVHTPNAAITVTALCESRARNLFAGSVRVCLKRRGQVWRVAFRKLSRSNCESWYPNHWMNLSNQGVRTKHIYGRWNSTRCTWSCWVRNLAWECVMIIFGITTEY